MERENTEVKNLYTVLSFYNISLILNQKQNLKNKKHVEWRSRGDEWRRGVSGRWEKMKADERRDEQERRRDEWGREERIEEMPMSGEREMRIMVK